MVCPCIHRFCDATWSRLLSAYTTTTCQQVHMKRNNNTSYFIFLYSICCSTYFYEGSYSLVRPTINIYFLKLIGREKLKFWSLLTLPWTLKTTLLLENITIIHFSLLDGMCFSISFHRSLMQYYSAIKSDTRRLQQTVRAAEGIISVTPAHFAGLVHLQGQEADRKKKIITDPTHPGQNLSELLPSRRRQRTFCTKTTRKKSCYFFPPHLPHEQLLWILIFF